MWILVILWGSYVDQEAREVSYILVDFPILMSFYN